jgi:hypothetical protein
MLFGSAVAVGKPKGIGTRDAILLGVIILVLIGIGAAIIDFGIARHQTIGESEGRLLRAFTILMIGVSLANALFALRKLRRFTATSLPPA